MLVGRVKVCRATGSSQIKNKTFLFITNLKLLIRIFPINTKIELNASSTGFLRISFNCVYPLT